MSRARTTVSRRQARRWGAQDAYAEPEYAPPPPPPPAAADPVERLTELARLRDQGALTEAEFAAAKARILAG